MLSTFTFDLGVVFSSVANPAPYLRVLNCCGRRPQRTMAAEGRKEGICDFSNVVAFGHNELCRPMGAKVSIKLARISAIGNTGVQSFYTGSSSSSSGAAAAAAAATASADTVVEQLQQQQQHWQQAAVGSGGAAAAVRGTAAAAATTYSHHTGQAVVRARGIPGW